MSELDYYELLDVSPTASPSEIKDAYRRAVRTAHPDVGGTSGMFRLITVAYETLSDPGRRADYDSLRGRGPEFEPGPVPEPDVDRSWQSTERQAADPGWGEETTWSAEEATETTKRVLPDRFAYSRNGRVTFVVLAAALVSSFAVGLAFLLYDPGALRPEGAGPDLLGWYADQPGIRLAATLVYAILLGVAWADSSRGVIVAHVVLTVTMVAWPIAYWDIATGERWWYLAGVALWFTYNGMLVAFLILGSARQDRWRYEGSRETREPSTLTSWARSGRGTVALRVGYAVTAALLLATAYVLVFGSDVIRPDAAGPDALGWILDYPVVLAVVAVLYSGLAYISIGYPPNGLEYLHLLVAIGLMSWPLAYWDLATATERWTFGVVVVTWALYVAAYYATSSIIDRRRPTPEWSR
ncbi:J domain-containing protein [Jiangella gansuensis]|uniref:J domain-containing protein n=1 Tax=Jiangella gansuensis TaxID=281473 RepID=UPI00047C0D69|nr:J domain-containing protein [Jiangella gansuensis]